MCTLKKKKQPHCYC
uniref:Uncharacterized protein n=1 Tax=Anguilla anguilla TaxID=7936 RepID=A0A0E9QK64_ANGAN